MFKMGKNAKRIFRKIFTIIEVFDMNRLINILVKTFRQHTDTDNPFEYDY